MRFVLTVINIALGMLAIALLVIGSLHAYYASYITGWTEEVKVEHVILTTGCLLLITAIIGWIVSSVERRFLFLTYGILLVFAHIVQIIMSVLCFLEIVRISDFINDGLTVKFTSYENTTDVNRKEVDRIQREWHCCGFSNLTTWEDPLPDSCCSRKKKLKSCIKKNASKKDCKSTAREKLQAPLKASGTFALLGAIFEAPHDILFWFFLMFLFQFFLALWVFHTAAKIKKGSF